jgi:hypothetical protein
VQFPIRHPKGACTHRETDPRSIPSIRLLRSAETLC